VLVEEPRELADRHAVPHRDRVEPDERLEPGHEHRSSTATPPIGFGRSHTMTFRAEAPGGLQAVGHRVDVRVNARADVLQIDDEDIHVLEHCRPRLARVAVERVHRHAPSLVARVRRFDHVLLEVPTGSRAVDRRGREPRGSRPGDRSRGRRRRRPSGVADDATRRPPGLPRPEALKSKLYGHFSGLFHIKCRSLELSLHMSRAVIDYAPLVVSPACFARAESRSSLNSFSPPRFA